MSAGIGNKAPRGSASDAGRMPLIEHLRELRRRLVRSIIAIILGAVGGWVLYDHIVHAMINPICQPGVVGPFSLQMKVALFAGIAFASPVWLYQLWAFMAPGLHRNEKRWAFVVVGAGVPLFALGAGLAYAVLPTAVKVLLGLAPTDVHNQVPLDEYLNFVLRMLFVFGVSFELPLIIVMMNLAGLVTARRVRSWWRGMTFGIFVFAAVATPTGDPGTMTVMATPMVFLYAVSIVITTLIDRRRARAVAD
jgi:sec-independent protein translocase protein TatC